MTGTSDHAIEYCGGEMDGWSDPFPADDLRALHTRRLMDQDRERVLLIGARAALLAASLLADGASVTVVVRGADDAARLAETGARVVCGSFTEWTPSQRFDTAVVLDPPGDVLPPSSEGIGSIAMVDHLRGLAERFVAFIPNAAGLSALDHVASAPSSDREFCALATGYDLSLPTIGDLPRQPAAMVFEQAVLDAEPSPSDPDRDLRVRTLLSSLLVDDLRYDALLAQPVVHADGWLVSDRQCDGSISYRRLDGTISTALTETVGTPVETRIRQLLVRGDLSRARTGLRAYAASGDHRTPLLRNAVATEGGFAAIDPQVADVDLATAMVDLASILVGPAGAHPFGPQRTRDEIAVELLRLAADSSDPETEIDAAASAYKRAAFARGVPEPDQATQLIVQEVRRKDAQLAALRSDLAKDRRHLRALEHALATESGPRAKRAFFLMTAPTKRLVEAVRRRSIG